jgi:hypothetical protein
MSIKNVVLSVTRRTKNGFTAGEVFDRVAAHYEKKGEACPLYSSVRTALVRLQEDGKLEAFDVRRDAGSGREALTYRHPQP